MVRQDCLDAGADDFLVKPALYDNLKNVLIKWLKTKNGRE